MKFLLDCLFISLVLVCIIFLFRLIRSRLLHKHRSPIIHPILLPIEHSADNQHEIKLNYELPFDSEVKISLLGPQEEVLKEVINKAQKAGNYYIKQQLPEGLSHYFLLFESTDTKILKRITVGSL